jgi:hypothetical protein
MTHRTLAALWFLFLVASSAGAQSRLEASGQFVVTDLSELDSTDYGFGGRLGFAVTRLFTFEGELNFFPSDIPELVSVSSSRLEGLFGVKVGPRFGRFSVFGKVRPGFVEFGEATEPVICILIFPPPLGCVLAGGETVFALDLGGGVEFFPSEQTLLRFDVSDLMLQYPGPSFNRDREAFDEDGFWGHNLRLAVSGGYRF